MRMAVRMVKRGVIPSPLRGGWPIPVTLCLTVRTHMRMMACMKNETIDLGNNETKSRGVFPTADGRFLAMTFSQSKTFKTERSAARWYARKGGAV